MVFVDANNLEENGETADYHFLILVKLRQMMTVSWALQGIFICGETRLPWM